MDTVLVAEASKASVRPKPLTLPTSALAFGIRLYIMGHIAFNHDVALELVVGNTQHGSLHP